MATWPIEQKLAVYELCRWISETLWQHDRDGLLEAMIRDDRDRGFNHAYDLDNPNLELPFEDDPSFRHPLTRRPHFLLRSRLHSAAELTCYTDTSGAPTGSRPRLALSPSDRHQIIR